MANPTTFRRDAGASAFRTPLNRAYWRDADRVRGGDVTTFRQSAKKSGGGKKSGKGGGS